MSVKGQQTVVNNNEFNATYSVTSSKRGLHKTLNRSRFTEQIRIPPESPEALQKATKNL
ncbi:MAG: hypothetical protein JEZ14_08130 [Marinilabiliaceae bacterium]|nr:hypothetical protein [Marinilabiliaceae bacterium]